MRRFRLLYKGVSVVSPVAHRAVAYRLAYELCIPFAQAACLLQQVGSPLFTQLNQEDVTRLTQRLTRMGIWVEVQKEGEA